MRLRYLIVLLLFFVSCFKSPEQQIVDREKAQKLVKEADAAYFQSLYDKALDLYLQAVKLEYDEPLLSYKIAFCYDKGPKDIDKAKEYYLKSLQNLNIQNNIKYLAATYFNLGVIALKEQEMEKKTDYFNSAYSLLQKMETMGKIDGEDYFRIGYYYWDRKDSQNARKYFSKALKNLKKENPHHFYIAAAYYNIGLTFWENDDNNTALWYWKKAMNLEPENEIYKTWVDKARELKQSSQ